MSSNANYLSVADGYEIDRSDEKWLHPLMRGNAMPADPSMGTIRDFFDQSRPLEERKVMVDAMVVPYLDFFMSQVNTPEAEEQGTWETYVCDATCPEEPDAPGFEVLVRIPKNPEGKPMPVVYMVGGGALAYSVPKMWVTLMLRVSQENNAVVISPRYRPAIEAPYPAAINDLHATWLWLEQNAERLNVDMDNVTLTGDSSGGHLAIALSFRLKRYGITPRGCVTMVPITDERMTKTSSRYYINDAEWDGVAVHLSAVQYLGVDNASPLVGPEAFPNHATIEDCRGLCPQLITTVEMDPDSDYSVEFACKCKEAGVYVDLHLWGGNRHGNMIAYNDDARIWESRVYGVFYAGIKDCIDNDLRRPWTA